MGNVEFGHAIRRVAPLLGQVAADLRSSPEAEALRRLIQAGEITDPDDLHVLAALSAGMLGRSRINHGMLSMPVSDATRAIRRVAPLFSHVASILRRSPAAAELAGLIRAGQLDPDDLEMLADLIVGLLNHPRGDRGRGRPQMNDAIRSARALAKMEDIHEAHRAAVAKELGLDPAKRLSLPKAAEVVARKHGVPVGALLTELRRVRPRRPR